MRGTRRNYRSPGPLLTLLLIFLLFPLLLTRNEQARVSLVTITEFSDFQCPYCKRAASVVEEIRQAYGDRVKFVFKQMPLPMHKQAFKSAQASVCAREQGKFWEYHDRLFTASDLSVDSLNRIATEVGLSTTEFNQCLQSDTSRAAVEKDVAEAAQLGVSGTPTFFINGKALRGAATFASLKQQIDIAMTHLPTQSLRIESAASNGPSEAQGSRPNTTLTSQVSVGRGSDRVAGRNADGGRGLGIPTLATKAPLQVAGATGSGATLSINDVTLAEDSCQNKSFIFTVTLSKLAGKFVTVQYATSDGRPDQTGTAAVANEDYVPVSGTLTFAHNLRPNGPNGSYLLTISVPLGNHVASSGVNDQRAFTLTLSGATNAIIAKAQGIGTLLNAATSCELGTNNACFVNYCGAAKSCTQVDRATCSVPVPGRPGGSLETEAACNIAAVPGCTARDADGDGFADAWETSGGYDFNCDGTITPDEMVLTNVDPVFPDGTLNPHPSANPSVKDVFVKYDWMELADQLNNGQSIGCTVNKLGPPYNFLLPHHSDACNFDQLCLPPEDSTATCNSLGDNCTCKGHTDEPSPAALRMVIEAYAAHGIRLHIVKGHAVPHANITYLGAAPAACTQEFSNQAFSGAQVANFYDIKSANFNASYNGRQFDEQHLYPVFHYVLFAHRHTCDSINDCNNTFCSGTQPAFNSTGLAEIPGNDVIISVGGQFDRNGTYYPDLAQGGTFMHELGHNLGLDHGGPFYMNGNPNEPNDRTQVHLNYKPNYISVMNYDFQTRGVSRANSNCAADDIVCRTTAVDTRLDYSSFCPLVQPFCDFTAKTVPNILDETNGTEAAGINIGNNDIGYTWSPAQTGIPASGPADFNGDGNATDTWCSSGCDFTNFELNNDPAGNGGEGTDLLLPFEDWPNLSLTFQCSLGYVDGTAAGIGAPAELTTDEILNRHLLYPIRPVRIQVLPSKMAASDRVRLVIFGGSGFDVNEVEPTSLELHGAKPVSLQIQDVNNDGVADLIAGFLRSDVRLSPKATRIHLSGWLKNSQIVFGEDDRIRFGR